MGRFTIPGKVSDLKETPLRVKAEFSSINLTLNKYLLSVTESVFYFQ